MIDKLIYDFGERCDLADLVKKINESANAINSITKENSPHKHDHDYFHDDCGLCQIEKAEFNKL